MTTTTTSAAFVRPRYDSGTSDAHLPLEDLVVEHVLGPDRGRLIVTGARGSGLTTTLQWVGDLARERGLFTVLLSDLRDQGLEAAPWAALESGEGVLLVDGSVSTGPLRREDEGAGRARRWLDPDRTRAWAGLMRGDPERLRILARARVVIASPWDLGTASFPCIIVRLAPWTRDDVLELLGADPALRPDRARVFGALERIPGIASLVARPRAARWLIDAAAALGPDEPVTVGRLYANVLDTLDPRTLEALRALRTDTPLAIVNAFSVTSPQAPPAVAASELGEQGLEEAALALLRWDEVGPVAPSLEQVNLFQLDPHLADSLARGGAGPVRKAIDAKAPVSASLALPGLHHFLRAGDAVRGIASGQVPSEVPDAWRPFLPELVTDETRCALRAWLLEGVEEARATWSAARTRFSRKLDEASPCADALFPELLPRECRRPAPEPAEPRHAPAATILWACGEPPPFDRPGLVLDGANLEGLALPGARWSGVVLGRARLSGARLSGAELSLATAHGTSLRGAELDGAQLEGLVAQDADLGGTRLRGARASGLYLEGCDLTRADLAGAGLTGACILGGSLVGASFIGADLHGAWIAPRDGPRLPRTDRTLLDLTGVDLTDASLCAARLLRLDLRRALLRPRSLVRARVELCGLSGLDLDGLRADGAKLIACELSLTKLRGASLRESLFVDCRAHDVIFDGADLSGARFLRARFQAGSTRAGLLVGQPALEGSMTGFYVEGTTDEAWASPDTLAQASFRGCDLRGAVFEDTNLFRVDLRGARLHGDLRAQAREQGAILD